MESIIDGAAKVLIDPWNHEFSMPGKCAASLLTAAIFVGSLGTIQLASYGWRYYRDIKENDTQNAISKRISSLVERIFPKRQASPSIQLKDILNEEELSQLRLYSEEPLPKDAKLPGFINLQRPITIVQQMGDDGKVKTFMAFKILADIHSKEQRNAKWIEQSVMYFQVSEGNISTICLMQDMVRDVAHVDEKNQLALLKAIIHDAEFKQEDKNFNVSYRLSQEAPSYISIDILENKDLANTLKESFGFTELPLYSKEPLSKNADVPEFRDLQEPITLVKGIGDDDKIRTVIAFKIKAFGIGKSESSNFLDFLVLFGKVSEGHFYLFDEAKDDWQETKIEADDKKKLFNAIIKKAPFKTEPGRYNLSYELTSYQFPKM